MNSSFPKMLNVGVVAEGFPFFEMYEVGCHVTVKLLSVKHPCYAIKIKYLNTTLHLKHSQ